MDPQEKISLHKNRLQKEDHEYYQNNRKAVEKEEVNIVKVQKKALKRAQ